jgi:hypothetical protein
LQLDKLKRYLKWYFCDSGPVLGQRSNYYTILNTAYGSTPSVDNEGIVGSLNKIGKHRLLHQAILTLDRKEIRYLYALYLDEYQYKYPLIIKNIFKERTGLALCLVPDPDGKQLAVLLDLCVKHRHQSLSKLEEQTLNQLIELTNKVYQRLHHYLQYNPFILKLK